ncbi:HD-GYP domain-containing protein [Alkalihalobacillus pseudalcaliphilus]|uniref:HD-GYP domain-containing protein n=1 Tax=Alkalihalobacillus pseudalcaliphilus TaxID=79884 RepID=UPI00064DB6FF|nr:HD-GYP domain-containing protein [Alkalihalobacillus pseudalcaliphilus]KMK77644.1 histidine kinase [Alkalihalobacillus pseudalcaliphilus]
MRLIAVMVAKPGQKLAKAVLNGEGSILLNKDILLTEKLIKRLKNLAVPFIYIKDDQIDLPKIEQVISQKTREETVSKLKYEFIALSNTWNNFKDLKAINVDLDFESSVKMLIKDIQNNPDALSLLLSASSHDLYIFVHSFNVAVYSIGLAMELGYEEDELYEIGLGALFHDIGKMFIPKDILLKPGKLTNDEFKIVQSHSKLGYDLLIDTAQMTKNIARCALEHHERLNGTGYPQAIKSGKIHPYAKIIAIADVFDAVTSNRSYRKPMLPHEALELLYSGASTLFDIDMVKTFRQMMAVYPSGLMVQLSDNRKGIVYKQNKQMSTHPVIKILYEDNIRLENPYYLNLMDHLNILIVGTEAFDEQL